MSGEQTDPEKQKKVQDAEEQSEEKSPAQEKGKKTEYSNDTPLERLPLQNGPDDEQEQPHAAGHDPVRLLSSMTHEERRLFLSAAGLSTFFKSTGRLFWTNFLMGLARGIGFVIGMSILGVLCVAIWNEFLSVTGIGEFIARLIEEVHKHTPASP